MTHRHQGHGKRWVLRWTPPAGISVDAGVFGRPVVGPDAVRDRPDSLSRSTSSAGCFTIAVEETGGAEPARLEQVHGNRVAVVTAPGVSRATDAAVTCRSGLPLTVRTADCVPIFVAGPGGVAVIHAGWRGTAAGITGAAVRELLSVTGHSPEDVAAFIGPSIGPCCYDVGPEVASAFDSSLLLAGNQRRPRLRLDLWRANRVQLEAAGIPPHRILDSRICTRCHQHLYHSHRGSGGKKGRIDAVIRLGIQD